MAFQNCNSRPLVVVVDGLIGAGKSTLIKECLIPYFINSGRNVTEVKEPVEKWKRNGRLEQYYKDPKRRAYQFQTMAFHSRVHECLKAWKKHRKTSDIFLLERSIFTDMLFMRMLLHEKMVDETEFEDYKQLWNMWDKVMPFQPHLFVYLRPTVETCMTRLKERNRNGESAVSVKYQEQLMIEHDKFLNSEYVTIGCDHHVPCIVLSTDSNFRDDENVKLHIGQKLDIVLKKIGSHQSSTGHG
jgi:deoxyadenosine/deoxycytidine kinase